MQIWFFQYIFYQYSIFWIQLTFYLSNFIIRRCILGSTFLSKSLYIHNDIKKAIQYFRIDISKLIWNSIFPDSSGQTVIWYLVLDVVGLAIVDIDGADEHVVGDVVQVAAVLEPGTGGADVVRGALAPDLDQHRHVDKVVAVPPLERREQLQAVGLGVDVDGLAGATCRRALVSVNLWVCFRCFSDWN